MVAVIGLDRHGQSDVLCGLPSVFDAGDQLALRHRHAAGLQQGFGQVFVTGNALGNGAGLVGLSRPDAALAGAKPQLHQVAFGQAQVRNAPFGGRFHNVGGAGAQAEVVNQLVQLRDRGFDVKRLVVNRGHDQVTARSQGGTAHLLMAGAKRYLVDPADRGFARFAKAGGHTGQVLQLQYHVLHDVAGPGALVQALHKTAALTHAAAVFDQAGQPGGEALHKAGQGVGGVVFQRSNVNPGFDDRPVSPNVGTAQVRNPQQLNILRGHESRLVEGASAAFGVLVDTKSPGLTTGRRMIIGIRHLTRAVDRHSELISVNRTSYFACVPLKIEKQRWLP